MIESVGRLEVSGSSLKVVGRMGLEAMFRKVLSQDRPEFESPSIVSNLARRSQIQPEGLNIQFQSTGISRI